MLVHHREQKPDVLNALLGDPPKDSAMLTYNVCMGGLPKKTKKGWKDGLDAWAQRNSGAVPSCGPALEECIGWLKNTLKDWHYSDPAYVSMLRSVLLWGISKTVIKIPQKLVPHLEATKPVERIPATVLRRLPNWTVYFEVRIQAEFSNGVQPMCDGLFVSLETLEGKDYLTILYSGLMGVVGCARIHLVDDLPMKEGAYYTHNCSMMSDERNTPEYHQLVEDVMMTITPQMLNIVLFACTQIPQLKASGHKPDYVKSSEHVRNWRIRTANQPSAFTVGQEICDNLERALSAARGTVGAREATIRTAHWHGYWKGPRAAPTDLIFHWLPPTVVAGFDRTKGSTDESD